MKPSKTLLIVAIVIVVLLLLAYLINMSNKKRIAAAISNGVKPDAGITGRYVASSFGTDYTEALTVNGVVKPKWLWAGKGNCISGYTKVLTGADAGWCILSQDVNGRKPVWTPPVGKEWCCVNNDVPCGAWKLCDIKATA